MSCSDVILYWLRLVFWLSWLPVKLLQTVQPLLSAIGQRETDQIDEQIVHHLQY